MGKIEKKLVAIIVLFTAGVSMNITAMVLVYMDKIGPPIFILAFVSVVPIVVAGEILRTWDNRKGGFVFNIIGAALLIIVILYRFMH